MRQAGSSINIEVYIFWDGTFAGQFITQKDTFLAAAKGVSNGIAFRRRLGAGLFGGEGFIMQRLDGNGAVTSLVGSSPVRRR